MPNSQKNSDNKESKNSIKLSASAEEFLSNNNIDINDKDSLNKALFYSVKAGNASLPLFLITLGADVNHKESGMTVIAAATVNGNETLIPFLTYLSTPETRRKTVEMNRELVDRFEGKVSYLKETIHEMGQEDVKKLNEEWEEAKKEKKKEEEKLEEEKKKSEQEIKLFKGGLFSERFPSIKLDLAKHLAVQEKKKEESFVEKVMDEQKEKIGGMGPR